MIIAVYPGSFDPFTLGHLNIVKRAATAFDKVIVCVMVNSQKNGMFTPDERVEMITRVVRDIPNVEVDCSKELVAEYAKRRGARVLVKGLRVISDYEAEMQMAMVNNKLNPELDTLFFPSSEKYTYISSTVVKEMMRYGIDLNEFIPREMVEDVKRKMCAKRRE